MKHRSRDRRRCFRYGCCSHSSTCLSPHCRGREPTLQNVKKGQTSIDYKDTVCAKNGYAGNGPIQCVECYKSTKQFKHLRCITEPEKKVTQGMQYKRLRGGTKQAASWVVVLNPRCTPAVVGSFYIVLCWFFICWLSAFSVCQQASNQHLHQRLTLITYLKTFCRTGWKRSTINPLILLYVTPAATSFLP